MDNWRTPPEIFKPLADEFGFDLDAAADAGNALVFPFLSDALNAPEWPGKRIWLNPPYGRMIEPFMYRAAEESKKGKTIVALIPARTRAAWWHEAILNAAHEIRFIRKRVRFISPEGERAKYTMGCDSVIVIYRGASNRVAAIGPSFIQEVL